MKRAAALLGCALLATVLPAASAPDTAAPEVQKFFRERIKLSEKEIVAIDGGKAVARILETDDKAEVAVFAAIFLDVPVETYLARFRDVAALEKNGAYLRSRKLSEPPTAADLADLALEEADIASLRKCKPADCDVQLPTSAIDEIRDGIDWSSDDASARVNQRLRELLLQGLERYRSGGLKALSAYRDKKEPTVVAEAFATLIGKVKFLPEVLPELQRYLLDYPAAKLEGAEDYLTWEKVAFGLKPTIRVNHVTIYPVPRATRAAYAIAVKQLYATHYFQTAVDLSFLIPVADATREAGFYLITLKGSRQAGLTGMKGSIIRGQAVGKTRDAMEKGLDRVKAGLKGGT